MFMNELSFTMPKAWERDIPISNLLTRDNELVAELTIGRFTLSLWLDGAGKVITQTGEYEYRDQLSDNLRAKMRMLPNEFHFEKRPSLYPRVSFGKRNMLALPPVKWKHIPAPFPLKIDMVRLLAEIASQHLEEELTPEEQEMFRQVDELQSLNEKVHRDEEVAALENFTEAVMERIDMLNVLSWFSVGVYEGQLSAAWMTTQMNVFPDMVLLAMKAHKK